MMVSQSSTTETPSQRTSKLTASHQNSRVLRCSGLLLVPFSVLFFQSFLLVLFPFFLPRMFCIPLSMCLLNVCFLLCRLLLPSLCFISLSLLCLCLCLHLFWLLLLVFAVFVSFKSLFPKTFPLTKEPHLADTVWACFPQGHAQVIQRHEGVTPRLLKLPTAIALQKLGSTWITHVLWELT